MKLFRIALVSVLAALSVSLAAGTTQAPAADPSALQFLGSFETLNSLGFTPDDVAYSPQGGRLMITASADSGVGARGVFEVTQDGRLVDSFPLPDPSQTIGLLGFSITRVSRGPRVGNFFMIDFNGQPHVTVYEFDPTFALVNSFPFSGSASPGDAIAFNQDTQTFMVPDGGSNDLFEITMSGEVVRQFNTNVHANGLTFNHETNTYFVVSGGLFEMSADGQVLRHFDITQFGARAAVGITSGQGKLFIADEGEPPNSSGTVYIFKAPSQVQ